MRTNIDLNDGLISEAMKIAGVSTKREAVEAALTAYVRRADHRDLLGLFGTNPERWDDAPAEAVKAVARPARR